MKKLNILQINSSSTWAGGEVHLKDLTKGLVDKGHKITLVLRNNIVNEFSNLNVNIEVLPLKNAIDMVSVFKLKNIIQKYNIDIIHAHRGIDYWLAVMARYLAKRGKVVATRHILVPLGKSFIHKKLYNSIDKFIAVSRRVKEKLISENNIPDQKINIVYNGMDIEKYENIEEIADKDFRQEFKVENKDFVVGMVGTLCERKNQELLIKIAAETKNENIKYLIAGEDYSSEKNYRQKLEELIKKFALEDQVILAGFREDIPQLMKFFDILVVPSHREAFGLVAIEAMAVETPVIASVCDGLKEIIRDEETGLLVPVDNKNKLKEAIFTLLNNVKKRKQLGREGYKYVKGKFDLKTMITEVEKTYFEICNK